MTRVLALAAFLVAGLALAAPDQAFARRGGPSPQQIKAMQQYMQQQQQMQANLAKAQQKKDSEVIARFDTNGNGKIDSNEKPAWDKYWREVKAGKQPHPYASISEKDVKPEDPKTAAKKK